MVKVGDKVKFVSQTPGYVYKETLGAIYIVESISGDNIRYYWKGGHGSFFFQQDIQLITNQNNMSIKEKFITAFLVEPEKSFRKTGITNGDGFLTEDGEQVFLGWLLKQNGAQFKTDVVNDLLKEQESEK